MSNYTVDFFIEKFEAIPEEDWCMGAFTDPIFPNRHCALGHCGVRSGIALDLPEAKALENIFQTEGHCVASVNDNQGLFHSTEQTPKTRVLAMLRKIRNKNADLKPALRL